MSWIGKVLAIGAAFDWISPTVGLTQELRGKWKHVAVPDDEYLESIALLHSYGIDTFWPSGSGSFDGMTVFSIRTEDKELATDLLDLEW